ncbi:MAG: hypothetical protein WA760_21885, partial [Pseudolabrys sp.]
RVVFFGEKIETAAGAKAARQKNDRASTGDRHPSATFRRQSRGSGHNPGCDSPEHEHIHAKLLPRKGGFAKKPLRWLSENTHLAMRLSRHSARIKAKPKPKSSGFQDTSGP